MGDRRSWGSKFKNNSSEILVEGMKHNDVTLITVTRMNKYEIFSFIDCSLSPSPTLHLFYFIYLQYP